MVNMTLLLPPHHKNRSKEILAVILLSQKRIVMDKWHQLLGELCSMTISLPSARGLFSHMQEALRHMDGK